MATPFVPVEIDKGIFSTGPVGFTQTIPNPIALLDALTQDSRVAPAPQSVPVQRAQLVDVLLKLPIAGGTEDFVLPGVTNVSSMRWQVTIASTKLPDREGTVKEFLSADEWQFSITGTVQGQNHVTENDGDFPVTVQDKNFPLNDFRSIVRLKKLRTSVVVVCDLLRHAGVGRIAIRECEIELDPNFPNQFSYRLSCESDSIDLPLA
jgi:hypothetical protein